MPIVGNPHRPIIVHTPSPNNKKNSRFYRNALSDDSDEDDVAVLPIVTESKPKVNAVAEHIHEVRKLLLGTSQSPANEEKNLAFAKLAQKDCVALAVLETTASLGMTAEDAKKRLVDVVTSNKN